MWRYSPNQWCGVCCKSCAEIQDLRAFYIRKVFRFSVCIFPANPWNIGGGDQAASAFSFSLLCSHGDFEIIIGFLLNYYIRPKQASNYSSKQTQSLAGCFKKYSHSCVFLSYFFICIFPFALICRQPQDYVLECKKKYVFPHDTCYSSHMPHWLLTNCI